VYKTWYCWCVVVTLCLRLTTGAEVGWDGLSRGSDEQCPEECQLSMSMLYKFSML